MNGKEEVYEIILDNTYFITDFEKLRKDTEIDSQLLFQYLWEMINLDFLKVMINFDEEIIVNSIEFEKKYQKYHYIATKKGLKWHNSI